MARRLAAFLLTILAAIAALQITAGDVVMRCTGVAPESACDFRYTPGQLDIRIDNTATVTGLAWWLVLMVVAFGLRRWGKKQLGLGLLVALPGALPLMTTINTGASLAGGLPRFAGSSRILLPIAGLILVVLVIVAKAMIWRLWWQLATGGAKPIHNS